MSQEHIWEKEYRNPQLLTRENRPQADIVRFAKALKKSLKKEGKTYADLRVVDIGSGTGRNSFYFAELGARVVGFEISDTALKIAKKFVAESFMTDLAVEYYKQDIGSGFLAANDSFDVALDITSSNSLDEEGRRICTRETHRVLKPGGLFLLKTLCKDGDEHSKLLIKESSGPEKDTYVLPGLGLTERVWSRDDLVAYYGTYFDIISMNKKTTYMQMNGRSYKRNFWIVEMRKKAIN